MFPEWFARRMERVAFWLVARVAKSPPLQRAKAVASGAFVFELGQQTANQHPTLATGNMFQKIAILGAGLIGASILQGARENSLSKHLAAWSRSARTRNFCAGKPWCDSVHETPAECVRGADLVIVCVPVDQIAAVLAEAAPGLAAGALVTDVGSTKVGVSRAAREAVPARAVFIGSHPMGGSEKAGPEHAAARLLAGHVCFVTPFEDEQNALAVKTLNRFWVNLGMTVIEVAPETHDAIAARTSHLPHLAACAVAGVLRRHPEQWSALGGPGLRDTTRVAAGDPEMWKAIATHNREEILNALDEYLAELAALRQAIAAGKSGELLALLAGARDWRAKLAPPPAAL
jgi:cyclohexadieny/prephenate dehydrogenase